MAENVYGMTFQNANERSAAEAAESCRGSHVYCWISIPCKACLGQAKILRSTGRLPMSYAGRTYDGGPLTAKMTSDIGFACIPASLG